MELIHTEKFYKKVKDGIYVEDPTGFNIGWEWLDESGVYPAKKRVIYTRSVDNLEEEYTTAEWRFEIFDPADGTWSLKNTDDTKATMNQFLDENTGIEELNPYDDNGVLKKGLVPLFEFLFDKQLLLFRSFLRGIQAKRFGATGFN